MADVDEILLKVEERMDRSLSALHDNFASVRTGRANAMVLDRITVDYYGTPTPVNQMAGIKSLKDIERAILESDLGVTPNNDGSVIRLPFPALTEERRRELAKMCSKYAEECRVAIRNARRDGNADIEKAQKNDGLPEDEGRRAEEQVQKMTDAHIASVDEALKKKEADIMEV